MFSPILAMVSAIASAMVMSPTLASLIFSTSAPTERDVRDHLHQTLNRSLRATKSVSELTSTTTPFRASHGEADETFGGDAAGLLGGLREALLAQQIDGLLHVAAGLLQRRLAIHHARAGAFAQLLDHLRVDFGHIGILLFRPSSAAGFIARTGASRRHLGAVSSFDCAIQPSTRARQSDLFADRARGVGPSPAICQ